MNELQIDRRAAACSLYFGLKAPYVVLPFGFGFIYHGIIAKNMTSNGVAMGAYDISLGIVCLIGVASAIGDAGSPVSDSTLGPTMGLNADGQHDHIWDTCVPTFVAYNIPLFAVGVLGSVLL